MISGNFEYKIDSGVAKITSYLGNEKKIEIPSKIDSYNVFSIESLSFLDIEELEQVILPDTIGRIETGAFTGCPNLSEIRLNIVGDLEEDAFCDCDANIRLLTKSSLIADEVKKKVGDLIVISEEDFKIEVISESKKECRLIRIDNCTDWISIPDEIRGYRIVELSGELKKGSAFEYVRLPKYLKRIPNNFFYNIFIMELELPEYLEEIGNKAFSFSEVRKIIKLPKTLKKIDKDAFNDCTWLRKLEILDGVEYIGEGAFSYCPNLTSIVIPDSVTEIKKGAFARCSKLNDVKLSKNITSLDDEIFWGCDELRKIEIPEGITKICNNAFSICKNLQEVNIPESVEYIGYGAFAQCENLEQVEILSEIEIRKNAFVECKNLKRIFHKGKISKDAPWSAVNARIIPMK